MYHICVTQANRRRIVRDGRKFAAAAAAGGGGDRGDVSYSSIVIQHLVRDKFMAAWQRDKVVGVEQRDCIERCRRQRHDGCADDGRAQHHVLLAVARHSEMVYHRAAASHRPRHCRQYVLRHHTPEPNVSAVLSEFMSSSSESNVPQVVDELHPQCAGGG